MKTSVGRELFEEIIVGNKKRVTEILSKEKVEINKRQTNEKGELCTFLYIACKKGHKDIVKLLLKQPKIDPDKGWTFRLEKKTPLYIACLKKYKGIVKYLMKAGANPNKGFSYKRTTPLHIVSEMGYLDILRLLVFNPKVDVNQGNTESTPLMIACFKKKVKVVNELLQHPEINPNLKSKNGYTALHIAAEKDDVEICLLLLLNEKTDVNSRGPKGNRPIDLVTDETLKLLFMEYEKDENEFKMKFSKRNYYEHEKVKAIEKKEKPKKTPKSVKKLSSFKRGSSAKKKRKTPESMNKKRTVAIKNLDIASVKMEDRIIVETPPTPQDDEDLLGFLEDCKLEKYYGHFLLSEIFYLDLEDLERIDVNFMKNKKDVDTLFENIKKEFIYRKGKLGARKREVKILETEKEDVEKNSRRKTLNSEHFEKNLNKQHKRVKSLNENKVYDSMNDSKRKDSIDKSHRRIFSNENRRSFLKRKERLNNSRLISKKTEEESNNNAWTIVGKLNPHTVINTKNKKKKKGIFSSIGKSKNDENDNYFGENGIHEISKEMKEEEDIFTTPVKKENKHVPLTPHQVKQLEKHKWNFQSPETQKTRGPSNFSMLKKLYKGGLLNEKWKVGIEGEGMVELKNYPQLLEVLKSENK